ncbi:MetQ/NlpA family ABC transporter substrate-binding protein [Streptococcus dentiloxodontae]
MKLKKILAVAGLVIASTVALAACGASKSSSDSNGDQKKTLRVGIMTLDDATEPVWDHIVDAAADKGITIKLTEFTDYNQPNEALQNGEIDVNAFQHVYFLNNWNSENKGDLVVAGNTLLSPIHLFSGTDSDGSAKYKDVKDLPDGATISIPNDGTNESRALVLLQAAGLIKLDVKDGELATIKNITENKKNLDIQEIDASQTAQTLTSVDAAVVNNSYAQSANVDYDTTLYQEDTSQNLSDWVNVIAAQKDWKDSDVADAIKVLLDVYQTDETAQLIYDSSNKVDLPAWDGAPTQKELAADSKKD